MSRWTLIDHLTAHLQKPRLGNSKEPTLWPSEASAIITNQYDEQEVVGKCRRATFFRYGAANYKYDPKTYSHLADIIAEVKEKILPKTPYTYWVFKAGDLYEEYVIEAAKESGVFIATQVQVYVPGIKISGKLDLVAINPETFKNRIVEVKSVHGHGAKSVTGSDYEQRKGQLGTPRDSHLMQIALYTWWYANSHDDFENSSLLYGARDSGKFAEYEVAVREEDDISKIFYHGISPITTKEVESPITINSIIEDGYHYAEKHVNSGIIPPRDFDIQYSDEKLALLKERKELSKKDSEQLDKIAARTIENAERIEQGLEPKRLYAPVVKGHWACGYCDYRDMCYDKDKKPREL